MDVSMVSGLASSLSSATQLAKALLGMKIDSEVRDAIIELQNSLISAQSAALGSLSERDVLYRKLKELEQQIESFSDWKSTRNKFVAVEFSTGSVAYQSADSEFEGIYCPKCLENRRISRMQEVRFENGAHRGECLQCETKLSLVKGAPMKVNSGLRGY